jgi:hypothetical protein
MRRVKWYFRGYLLSIRRYGNKEEGSAFYENQTHEKRKCEKKRNRRKKKIKKKDSEEHAETQAN